MISIAMKYPTITVSRQLLFPFIREQMAVVEPAPLYENEAHGLAKLESTFTLMRSDHYPDLLTKAAYLFCSIIDGHPFSNGNKCLGVASLTYFLITNGIHISAPSMEAVRMELRRLFPKLRWEDIGAFRHSHEYFFYHLALIIADRSQKGQMTFKQEQSAVRQLLEFITSKIDGGVRGT